ncbi:diacylglycerol kinase family protein [Microbacterium sp. 18062]|uniref:diacylglycerol/lipid kinase family protein n=1 Tax=Microbacterium sp. 18062 TaxID=2681410 RepID=UPI001F32DB0E
MERRHAAVVYNPVKSPLDRLRRAVDAEQLRQGWEESRWFPSSGEDAGRRAAEDALRGEPAVVIVAGGDGTLRAVAELAHEGSIPLALVPTGTGNLLARNLGLAVNDLERSVRVAFTGGIRAVDIAVADMELDGERSRHAFVVMAGIGLDAEMARDTNPVVKKRIGWLAYVTPIARSIIRNRQFHLRYRVDGGHARSTRAHTVIVGNCGMLTGNMLLIPAAVVDDGLLDVVMMRPGNGFGWAQIGTRLTLQGIAHRSRAGRRMFQRARALPALAYAQGRQFEVRFDTAHAIELDGDDFGSITSARITVHPAGLRLVVPDRA